MSFYHPHIDADRRLRQQFVRIHPDHLLDLFRSMDGTRAHVCENLPPDARAVRFFEDPHTGELCLVIESASCYAVEPGNHLCEMPLRFRTIFLQPDGGG